MVLALLAPDQGEHNIGSQYVSGNSLGGYGYGCQLPELVRKWRQIWSEAPGTTEPEAPFGVVTVAADGGWHGARDFGGFRWAQTANYGALPNPAMPNTFLAQAYDTHDPWWAGPRSETCAVCCPYTHSRGYDTRGNDTAAGAAAPECAAVQASLGGPQACAPYCEMSKVPYGKATVWIHPRSKRRADAAATRAKQSGALLRSIGLWVASRPRHDPGSSGSGSRAPPPGRSTAAHAPRAGRRSPRAASRIARVARGGSCFASTRARCGARRSCSRRTTRAAACCRS